ncbi:PAS domain-containing protein [Streptococcus plurextorum]|uniref:PAS domain-containing protein n=1 Tax=Streptococcus plurextorum TaxID=456876 RepID=UPI000413A3E4|nr:PAS domain-containing protein [Streptococcus plurextorum]
MNYLDFLPYKTAFYDQNLQLAYSNGKADGTFFPSQDQVLPQWVWQELSQSTEKSLHLEIPNEAFGQVFMQSYIMLFDDSGDFQGVMETVQDIKPILSSYLENSAQALVGWSDVISGASISNEK